MTIRRDFLREAVVAMHGRGTLPSAISRKSGIPMTTIRRWINQGDPEYHERNLATISEQKQRKAWDMHIVAGLRQDGLTPTQIARRLGMNIRRVSKLLSQYKQRHDIAGKWQTPGERVRELIAALRERGLDIRTIAHCTHRSVGTVHYHLRKLGLDGNLKTAKPLATKSGDANTEKAFHQTGQPAEVETHALLTHVAAYTDGRIRSIYPSPDNRYDLLLIVSDDALAVHHTLTSQVRTASWRGKSLLASITRANGQRWSPVVGQ